MIHSLLAPSFVFKSGQIQTTKEVTFSDDSLLESPPKKQKFQLHRKREREEDYSISNSEQDNSFEFLNSSRESPKITKEEDDTDQEAEKEARAARADIFNFENMKRATPVKATRTPSRNARAPARRDEVGYLQDGSQYFMYAYQDFIGNQLVNLEVQLQGPAEEGNVHVELVDLPGGKNKQGIAITQSMPETWLSTNFYSRFLKENKSRTY